MAIIELQGSASDAVIVDDLDECLVRQHRWYKDNHGYACTNSNGKNLRLHALLLPKKEDFVRDHINGNKLDNRRANLRYATPLENAQNASKRKDNTSGFKGVYWNKQYSKWKVQIRHEGKRKHLGRFEDVIAAAKAYDDAAKSFFGKFARVNFN